MVLGGRIKDRLAEIGLSQAELARRVGIRQSTLNSLIRGKSYTTRSLLQIARELGTTPAYLTGESDDPHSDAPPPDLSSEERELVDLIRSIEPKDRKIVVQLIGSLAEKSHPPTLHAQQQEYKRASNG